LQDFVKFFPGGRKMPSTSQNDVKTCHCRRIHASGHRCGSPALCREELRRVFPLESYILRVTPMDADI
jgi:hypothetical protein